MRGFGAALVLALLGFSLSAHAAEKISLLFSPTAGLMPAFVAKDEGIFAKHGLDVDLVLLTNQGAVISALVSDSAQIGTPSALAIIQASDSGVDTVFVAATSVSPAASRAGIFVKNGSNIHAPADLIGKRIGVPSFGTMIHVLARRWLSENHVDYDRVNFAEIGFQQMADALGAGIVDAADTIDPYYDHVAQFGYLIGDPDASLPKRSLTAVYGATRLWADAHKDAVSGFRQSLAEGTDWVLHNEPQARKILAKYTHIPDAVAATTPFPAFDQEVRPAQVQFYIDLARQQKLITSNPSAANLIAP